MEADITAVASPITLSECLVGALRLELVDLEQAFVDVLLNNEVVFVKIEAAIARAAARIRVRYNLRDWRHKRHLQRQEVAHIMSGVQQGIADLKAGRIKPAEEVLTRLEKKYQVML